MTMQTEDNLVMLVEDHQNVRESTAILLETAGYSVVGVSNGRHALYELCRMSKLPNLILLDLLMPELDGWGFCEELQRNAVFAKIPVVVLSAVGGDSTGLKNVVGRLRKPARVEEIILAIEQAAYSNSCRPLVEAPESDRAGRWIDPTRSSKSASGEFLSSQLRNEFIAETL